MAKNKSPLTSPSYGPRPKAESAMEKAWDLADKRGINPREEPGRFGELLSEVWESSPSYGPRPKAGRAQDIAHSKADKRGINPRWQPERYGMYLSRAWDSVMPSQLGPSQAKSLKGELKDYMDKAWDYAKDHEVSLAEAMEKVEHPFEPSAGPPPPVPGAPSQVGAGWHGTVAGSPESKEAMERAWEIANERGITPRSDPKEFGEILEQAQRQV